MHNTNRKCPYCAEEVRSEAIHCRFCDKPIAVRVIINRRDSYQPTAKELHSMALSLMRFKKGLFSYQGLKQSLSEATDTLAENIAYSEAQSLLQHARDLPYSLNIEEMPLAVEEPSLTSQPVATQPEPAPASTFDLARALQLTILFFVATAAVFYGYKWHMQKNAADEIVAQEERSENSKTPVITEAALAPLLTDSRSTSMKPQEILVRATATITDGRGIGSGFFIRGDGYLLTNAHVVDRMTRPQVILENGRRYRAEVLKTDAILDVALVKVEGSGFPTLKLGDATKTSRGETVWTVGAPHGLNFTLTKGIVSYVGRNMNGIAFLQTDAPINSGNSGGPMINEQGDVVGINTFIIRDTEGLGFALPVNYLVSGDRPFLQGILNLQGANSTMQQWLNYASKSTPQPYNRRSSRRLSPRGSSNSNQTVLSSLARESKRLDESFNAKVNKFNKTLARLNSKKKLLEKRYYGDNVFSMNVSQEAQIGRELKSISKQILETQIQLLKSSKKYYKAKKTNIKSIIGYLNNDRLEAQYQNTLSQVNNQLNQTEVRIEQHKQEMRTLQSSVY